MSLLVGSCRSFQQHDTTTVLRPFFWNHPVEPVPEENFWTLWCKGRLTEADADHPAGRHSIRTTQCPPPPSPIFYRPDALPAARPTLSKHWRQLVSLQRCCEIRSLLVSPVGGPFIFSNLFLKTIISLNKMKFKSIMSSLHLSYHLSYLLCYRPIAWSWWI